MRPLIYVVGRRAVRKFWLQCVEAGVCGKVEQLSWKSVCRDQPSAYLLGLHYKAFQEATDERIMTGSVPDTILTSSFRGY